MVRVNVVEMLLEISSEVVLALPVYKDICSLKPPYGSRVQSASDIFCKTNTSWTGCIFCRPKADVVLLFCNTALATL